MNTAKTFLWTFLLIFFSSQIYSQGFYDNYGNYNYYVSNPSPQINITIEAPAKEILVNSATIRIVTDYTHQINDNLDLFEKKTYSFTLPDFGLSEFSITDEIYFFLDITDTNSNSIRVSGPTNFQIILDLIQPQMVFPNSDIFYLSYREGTEMNFEFSEKIMKYSIYVGGDLVFSSDVLSAYEKDYSSEFTYDFQNDLYEGANEVRVEFIDFAGNANSKTMTVNYRGEPLSVKLLTSHDDSSLDYYYNPHFPEFFQDTIYTKENEFDLVVQTNKRAVCYYSISTTSHLPFNSVTTKTPFSELSDLRHSWSINLADYTGNRITNAWIACQNPIYPEEVVYLKDVLNIDDLIKIERLPDTNLEIGRVIPSSLVSYSPFDITLFTNKPAICSYEISSSDLEYMTSDENSYLQHTKEDLSLSDGNYNINFECFDKIGNTDSYLLNLRVDQNLGIKVTEFNPKYTDKSSLSVSLTLSKPADCRYSFDKYTDFYAIPGNATGEGINKVIELNSLQKGDNLVYIYCLNEGNVDRDDITIVYDPDGPKLSNLTFVNNNIPSDYVGSLDKIQYKVSVDSLIPVNKFFIQIYFNSGNSSYYEFSSNQATIGGNFSDATKISIIGQNEMGKNSSRIEKSIKFDLNPPQIKFTPAGNSVGITCIDLETSCTKIYYGFSDVSFTCNPSIFYDENETLLINDNAYICARAYDEVGNEKLSEVFSLSSGYDSSGFIDDNQTTSVPQGETNQTIEVPSQGDDEDPYSFPTDSGEPIDTGSGINYILIAAIFLVIAGVGGGGYYAYSKGYLDKELAKFGIKRKSNTDSSSYYSSTQRPQAGEAIKNNGKASKSRYDNHLSRLNKFIDDALNKKSEIFDHFKSDGKGKVEGYDDTLIKGTKKRPANMSKEEFDEFYKKSNSTSSNSKDPQNIEKEAEEFEKYYKDKKIENPSETKSKKESNKK